jgi:hypothetical protein
MTLSVVPPMPSAHCQSRVLKTQSIHSDNCKRGGGISERKALRRMSAMVVIATTYQHYGEGRFLSFNSTVCQYSTAIRSTLSAS